MKRIVALIIAALMVCPLMSGLAEGDFAARAEHFEDVWVDDGVAVEIYTLDDALRCTAVMGSGEGTANVWEYDTVYYDADSDMIVCGNGRRTFDYYDEAGQENRSELVVDGLSASLGFDDEDRLIWNDSEGICKRFLLQRLSDAEEEEYRSAADRFVGDWLCDDTALNIRLDGEDYAAVVRRAVGEGVVRVWEYACWYDDMTDAMIASGAARSNFLQTDSEGNVNLTDEETVEGAASFRFSAEGHLLWNEEAENAGEAMAFAPADASGGVPTVEILAEDYFRAVARIEAGSAGASLKLAETAARVCALAAEYGLWDPEVYRLRENLLAAWKSLTEDERAAFGANLLQVTALVDACFEDWEGHRALFEDAGAAETMEEIVYDPLNRLAWSNLRAFTRAMDNSDGD